MCDYNNDVLNNQTPWYASDGFRSCVLPDGNVLWLYGDTVLDGMKTARNSMSIWNEQKGYIRFSSGSDDRGFIVRNDAPDPQKAWYWTGVPIATNAKFVHIPVNKVEFANTGNSNMFDFKVTGQDIVSYVYDPKEIVISRIGTISTPRIVNDTDASTVVVNWGAATVRRAWYTYLYGIGRLNPERDGYGFSVTVMRMLNSRIDAGPTAMAGQWQVLTTTGWRIGSTFKDIEIRTIGHEFSNIFSVTESDGKLYAVVKSNEIVGNTVDLYEAPHEYGQFRKVCTLATIDVDPNLLYYHVNVHPRMSAPEGKVWATVARNNAKIPVMQSPHTYRPLWLLIPEQSKFSSLAEGV